MLHVRSNAADPAPERAGITVGAKLRALADAVGLADEIDEAATDIALRLVGRAAAKPCALATLLFSIADAELRVLESVCHRDPFRAGAAATWWLEHIMPRLDPSSRETAELREQLAVLLARRLPDGFPLPTPRRGARIRSPLQALMELRRVLRIGAATAGVVRSVAQCSEIVVELAALLPGFGWDFTQGDLQRVLSSQIDRLSHLVARLASVRRIADELGRMEASEKTTRIALGGGRDCVVGVRCGSELSDVLPCELALLSSPDTEDLFYARYAEHRLMCLELDGMVLETTPSSAERGPVIACIDTSGSMQGPPEEVAKAIVLATARRAIAQGRSLHLLLFGGPGNATDLVIRRGASAIGPLIDFLSQGFHAGTDYDTPLCRAVKLLATPEFAKADILVVTDGLCRASASVVGAVAEATRTAQARVISVVIGHDTGGVDEFSDDVWVLDANASVPGGLDLERWRVARREVPISERLAR
jgi:hypothetical protein